MITYRVKLKGVANMKRIVVLGLVIVLFIGAGAGYLFMQKNKQKQAQCQQQIQHNNLVYSRSLAKQKQVLGQLRHNNKTLTAQNQQLVQKVKADVVQAQKQMDKLQQQNQQLQQANQTLKQGSARKIHALAADLRRIQREQKALKADYSKRVAKPAPVKSTVEPVKPKQTIKHAEKKQHDAIKTSHHEHPKTTGLSLVFPAPNSKAVHTHRRTTTATENYPSAYGDDK